MRCRRVEGYQISGIAVKQNERGPGGACQRIIFNLRFPVACYGVALWVHPGLLVSFRDQQPNMRG